ncbi:hypothetical protein Bhyg_05853, partial [Pseudolycoriella hygida]
TFFCSHSANTCFGIKCSSSSSSYMANKVIYIKFIFIPSCEPGVVYVFRTRFRSSGKDYLTNDWKILNEILIDYFDTLPSCDEYLIVILIKWSFSQGHRFICGIAMYKIKQERIQTSYALCK